LLEPTQILLVQIDWRRRAAGGCCSTGELGLVVISKAALLCSGQPRVQLRPKRETPALRPPGNAETGVNHRQSTPSGYLITTSI